MKEKAKPTPPFSVSQLRKNLYRVIDQVIASGKPAWVKRNGVVLKIEAPSLEERFKNVKKRKVVIGRSEDLAEISWEKAWKPEPL